jgi:hypothetical protein
MAMAVDYACLGLGLYSDCTARRIVGTDEYEARVYA